MGIIKQRFFEEVTFLGGFTFFLILSFIFFILGHTRQAIQVILALFIIYFLTLIIRSFYFKPRPKKIKHTNFVEKIDASSFPSVHAARITFLSLFLLTTLSPTLPYILVVLVLWFLTLYSRIYLYKHYFIDLIGGILLGILTRAIVYLI